jgi:hypothetical protein
VREGPEEHVGVVQQMWDARGAGGESSSQLQVLCSLTEILRDDVGVYGF